MRVGGASSSPRPRFTPPPPAPLPEAERGETERSCSPLPRFGGEGSGVRGLKPPTPLPQGARGGRGACSFGACIRSAPRGILQSSLAALRLHPEENTHGQAGTAAATPDRPGTRRETARPGRRKPRRRDPAAAAGRAGRQLDLQLARGHLGPGAVPPQPRPVPAVHPQPHDGPPLGTAGPRRASTGQLRLVAGGDGARRRRGIVSPAVRLEAHLGPTPRPGSPAMAGRPAGALSPGHGTA